MPYCLLLKKNLLGKFHLRIDIQDKRNAVENLNENLSTLFRFKLK